MSQAVTIHYKPVARDYANVLRIYFLRRTGTRISLVFLVIAFGLIIFALIRNGTAPSIYELTWLVLPLLFLALVFYYQPKRIEKQVAKNDQLLAETTWEVGDAGLQISSQFGSTHLDWEVLSMMVATKEYFLLLFKDNKRAFRFLPRRAFPSVQEEEQFSQLVAGYLKVQ